VDAQVDAEGSLGAGTVRRKGGQLTLHPPNYHPTATRAGETTSC